MNNTLKAVLVAFAFAGVFLSGGVIGGVFTARVAKERFQRFQHEREERMIEQQQQQLAQIKQALEDQQQLALKQMMIQGRAQQQARSLPGPEQFSAQLMRRFSRQLDLTPDQTAKILPMVNDAAESMRRLRRETAHNFELTLDHVEDEIAAVLTPEQRIRFNDLIQTQRERLQRYREQQARMNQQRPMGQP